MFRRNLAEPLSVALVTTPLSSSKERDRRGRARWGTTDRAALAAETAGDARPGLLGENGLIRLLNSKRGLHLCSW